MVGEKTTLWRAMAVNKLLLSREKRMSDCQFCESCNDDGKREQERIIKLIEENIMTMTSPLDNSVMRSLRMSPSELIALIKGETND
jgi:hypothetical protein